MYRLLFKGNDNTSLSVAGLSLPANKYVYVDTLPMSLRDLRKLCSSLDVELVKERAPAVEDDKKLAVATGKVGVRWEGTVLRRYTEYGWFNKGETRWNLQPDAVTALCRLPGFVKVGG